VGNFIFTLPIVRDLSLVATRLVLDEFHPAARCTFFFLPCERSTSSL